MAINIRGANANSGDTSTASVTLPSGTSQGDFLIMILDSYSGSVTFSDPSGWTNIAGSDVYTWNSGSGLCKSKVWFKIAGASESNPSITLSTARRWSMSIAGYTGVSSSNPVNTTENTGWSRSSTDAPSGNSVTSPSLTASSGQWLVGLCSGGDDASTTWTNDRTERTDNQFFDTLSASTSIGDSNSPVTGSVTIQFTPSGTQQGRAVLAVLLNEATGTSTENIYLDSSITGSCSTPNNALGAADGTFTTDTSNTSWDHTWHYPAPSTGGVSESATQTFVLRVRKQSGSGTPTIDTISVGFNQGGGTWSSHSISGSPWSVTSLTGENITVTDVFSGTFGFSTRVDDQLRFRLITTAAGGGPSNRAAVQVDAVNWQAEVTAAGGGGPANSVGILYG